MEHYIERVVEQLFHSKMEHIESVVEQLFHKKMEHIESVIEQLFYSKMESVVEQLLHRRMPALAQQLLCFMSSPKPVFTTEVCMPYWPRIDKLTFRTTVYSSDTFSEVAALQKKVDELDLLMRERRRQASRQESPLLSVPEHCPPWAGLNVNLFPRLEKAYGRWHPGKIMNREKLLLHFMHIEVIGDMKDQNLLNDCIMWQAILLKHSFDKDKLKEYISSLMSSKFAERIPQVCNGGGQLRCLHLYGGDRIRQLCETNSKPAKIKKHKKLKRSASLQDLKRPFFEA